jgi:hypothetical protein
VETVHNLDSDVRRKMSKCRAQQMMSCNDIQASLVKIMSTVLTFPERQNLMENGFAESDSATKLTHVESKKKQSGISFRCRIVIFPHRLSGLFSWTQKVWSFQFFRGFVPFD